MSKCGEERERNRNDLHWCLWALHNSVFVSTPPLLLHNLKLTPSSLPPLSHSPRVFLFRLSVKLYQGFSSRRHSPESPCPSSISRRRRAWVDVQNTYQSALSRTFPQWLHPRTFESRPGELAKHCCFFYIYNTCDKI